MEFSSTKARTRRRRCSRDSPLPFKGEGRNAIFAKRLEASLKLGDEHVLFWAVTAAWRAAFKARVVEHDLRTCAGDQPPAQRTRDVGRATGGDVGIGEPFVERRGIDLQLADPRFILPARS